MESSNRVFQDFLRAHGGKWFPLQSSRKMHLLFQEKEQLKYLLLLSCRGALASVFLWSLFVSLSIYISVSHTHMLYTRHITHMSSLYANQFKNEKRSSKSLVSMFQCSGCESRRGFLHSLVNNALRRIWSLLLERQLLRSWINSRRRKDRQNRWYLYSNALANQRGD